VRRCGERIAVGLHDRHLWAPLPACSIRAASIWALRASALARLPIRSYSWTRHQGEFELVIASDLAKVDGKAECLAQQLKLFEAVRTYTLLSLWAGVCNHKAGTMLKRKPSEALNWYEAEA